MENASKASIHLRNQRYLRENFLEFIALQGVYKSFTAESSGGFTSNLRTDNFARISST